MSGTNFLLGILLVRYLGVEQYGKFVLAWMAIQFFAGIQNALIVSPMLSVAPKIPEQQRAHYYSSTIVMQVGLVVLLVTILAVSLLVPKGWLPTWLAGDIMAPVIICLVFVQFQDFLRRNLFSRKASRQAFQLDLVAYGLQLPLIFMVLRSNPSFEYALLIIASTMAFSLLLGFRWLVASKATRQEVAKVTERHWHSSKWLLGSAILQWLSGNYFLIVAGVLLGPVVVGAIRAAQNILGLTHILFQGLENVVPGEASHILHLDGTGALSRYLYKVAAVLIGGTGLVALTAASYAEPLLLLVYGVLDQNSLMALLWYVPLYLLVAAALPLRAGLRSLERTRAIFIAYMFGAIFSLLFATLLVGQHGVAGVMSGMLIVQVIMTLVLFTSLRRGLQII